MLGRSFFVERVALCIAMLIIGAAAHSQRPNIIYIMTDDLGYADLSCYGRKTYQTPHLDKLSTEGMKFMRAYAAAPVCTPTRTAFMTGRYPARTTIGLLEPWVPSHRDSAIGLSAGQYAVAALVKKAGYATALIGKWHLGGTAAYSPLKNGFDYFFGNRTGALDYVSHKGDNGIHDLYENGQPVYPEGYMTDLIGGKVIDYIRKAGKTPFFLSVQFTAPHWPWQGPGDAAYPDTARLASGGTPAIYAAMMKSLDDQVGKIMAALAETGLDKNTVVIFTSDNGGERFSDMGPFSKGKMNVWEGGLRVPAFVRWPGHIKDNSTTAQPVITMDWTATILSLAGAKPAINFPIDGMDLLPLLTGNKKSVDRTFFWRITQRRQQHAVLDGTWKYLQDENGSYLFDLASDPGEKNDLKATQGAIYSRLKQKYAGWEKAVLPPVALK
jgi:arylsulfatase A-like enzyme